MNTAEQNDSTVRSRRRISIYPVLFVVMVLMLVGGFAFILLSDKRSPFTMRGVSFGFGGPAKSMSFTSGPVAVEVTPDLAAEGWEAEYFGTGSSASSGLFYHRETRSIKLKLTRHQQPSDGQGLRYTGLDDQEEVVDSGSLAAPEGDVITIDFDVNGDQRPPARVLIHK
jgi:hypothetical protein